IARERDAVVRGVLVPMPTKRPLSKSCELPKVVPSVVNFETKLRVPDKAPASEPQRKYPAEFVLMVSQSGRPSICKPPVDNDERRGPAKVAVAEPRTSKAPERSRFTREEVPERDVMMPSERMVPPTLSAVLMVDEPRVSNELPTLR